MVDLKVKAVYNLPGSDPMLFLKSLLHRKRLAPQEVDGYKIFERVANDAVETGMKLTPEFMDSLRAMALELDEKNRLDRQMSLILKIYNKVKRYCPDHEKLPEMDANFREMKIAGVTSSIGTMRIYDLEKLTSTVAKDIKGMQEQWIQVCRQRYKDAKFQYDVNIARYGNSDPNLRKSKKFRDAFKNSMNELHQYVRGETAFPTNSNASSQLILLISRYQDKIDRIERTKKAKPHYQRLVRYKQSSKNPSVHELAKSAIKDLNAYLKEGIRPVLKPKYEGIEALIKEEARGNFQDKMKTLGGMLCPKLPEKDIEEVKGLLKEIGDYAPVNSLKPLAEGINNLRNYEVKDYLKIAANVNGSGNTILTDIPAFLRSYEKEDRVEYLKFLALMSNRGVDPAECYRKLDVAMTMVRDKKHFFKSLEIFYHNPRKNDIEGIITIAKMYDEIPYNRPGVNMKTWHDYIRNQIGSQADC